MKFLFLLFPIFAFSAEKYLTVISNDRDQDLRLFRTTRPLGRILEINDIAFISGDEFGFKAKIEALDQNSITWAVIPDIIAPVNKGDRVLMSPYQELLFRNKRRFDYLNSQEEKPKESIQRKLKYQKLHGISFKLGGQATMLQNYDFVEEDSVDSSLNLLMEVSYLFPINKNLFFAPLFGISRSSFINETEKSNLSSTNIGANFIVTLSDFYEGQGSRFIPYFSFGIAVGVSEVNYQGNTYEGHTVFLPRFAIGTLSSFFNNQYSLIAEITVDSQFSEEDFNQVVLKRSSTLAGFSFGVAKFF
jgi:hypothetical protein